LTATVVNQFSPSTPDVTPRTPILGEPTGQNAHHEFVVQTIPPTPSFETWFRILVLGSHYPESSLSVLSFRFPDTPHKDTIAKSKRVVILGSTGARNVVARSG
jgi:hypothetical protein